MLYICHMLLFRFSVTSARYARLTLFDIRVKFDGALVFFAIVLYLPVLWRHGESADS